MTAGEIERSNIRSGVNYGVFSGYTVWFVENETGLMDVTVQKIGGYTFIHTSKFWLYAEKEGIAYTVAEVLRCGLMTGEDVAELYRIHREHEIEDYEFAEQLYEKYE